MHTGGMELRRNAAGLAALLALASGLQGCSTPTAPPSPPAGGQQLHLSFDLFAATVEPVLVRHGCDAGGDCHGGGIRGTLRLSPQGAKNVTYDFNQVSLEKPLALAAGGTPHQIKPFATTSDSDYQAILHWIQDGASK